MIINLNESEHDYLQREILSKTTHNVIPSLSKLDDSYLLEISEEQADLIRDLCSEQLQLVGFDEQYNLTQEGKILESLIDKFFVG